MKKTLITLAALAMASVAQALIDEDQDGLIDINENVTGGVWLYAGETDINVDGTESWSIDAINGHNGSSTDATYDKTGTGTLTVTNANSGYNSPNNVKVSAGKLVISYDGKIVNKNVSVASGATLELNGASVYGNATDNADPQQLELNGGTISGSGSLALQGGVIAATGTGNIVSVDLKRAWNVNIDVATGGDLTFSGDLIADNGNADFVKSGAGELVITTETLDSAFTMKLNAGTLDISSVSSMGALTAADNTTIKVGGDSLAINGALTLGSGVTLDMSEWTGTLGDAFSGVTSLTSASPVTVLLADGTSKQMTLSLSNGSVSVPEPATATLSLLALAGLAARRRRK